MSKTNGKKLWIVERWESANGCVLGQVEMELGALRWHHDCVRCLNYVGLIVLALVVVIGMALWYSDHQIAATILGLLFCAAAVAFLVWNRPADIKTLDCEAIERFLRDFVRLSKVLGLSMDLIDSMPMSAVAALVQGIMEIGIPKNRIDNANLFRRFGLMPR